MYPYPDAPRCCGLGPATARGLRLRGGETTGTAVPRPATAVAWQTTGTAVPDEAMSAPGPDHPTVAPGGLPTAAGAVGHATAVAGFFAITQRPHQPVWPLCRALEGEILEVGRLKHHRVARAAAAARHDAHPALNLPGVQDHILVTLPHPERTPVATGNASGCTPAGRRGLIGRLLTRKQTRHLVLPYLSYAFSIPASSNYVKKSPGRDAWDGRRVLYSLQTNNAPAWQKITR